jgi:CRP/FNR family transcriptional regulator, cyclic AMP receptor protein
MVADDAPRSSSAEPSVPGAGTLVLEEDPGLGAVVAPERADRARSASMAGVLRVRAGSWDAMHDAPLARGGFGLLVLAGVLIRRVGVDGRFGAELLGPGDLLRPWQHDGEADVLPFEMTWRVVAPVRMAVLDLRWAARMAPFPEVAAELAGRALERSRRLAMLMAISQQPRLDARLWLLFWELADRHGRVHPDGVHLDLPLTHEVISHLAAARRPSVSTALSRLAARGIVRRAGRGWVLHGEPPGIPPDSDVALPETP